MPACPAKADPRLAQTVAGIAFPNPLGMAAGYDKNAEVPEALLRLGFGFTEIGTVIAEVNDITGKVARASEDQSQATAGIARNIDDAFRVVGEIAGNIQALAQAAATTETHVG